MPPARLLAAAVALLVAGCLAPPAGPAPPPAPADAPASRPDEVPRVQLPPPAPPAPPSFPWPRGDEWPSGLRGPFDLAEIRHLPLSSFDGVILDGWVYLPALPEGVRAPVVLWSAPYFGNVYPWADDPQVRKNDSPALAVPIDLLVAEGYAVAVYSLRGTGNSGGCFGWFGPQEQRDQAVLVEHLAGQPFSNGRVGMMGLSYHGATAWQAAVQAPPHLATIVTGGIVTDAYVFARTPQGAPLLDSLIFGAYFAGLVSHSPPVLPYLGWRSDPQPLRSTVEHLPARADRLCPDAAKVLAGDAAGFASGDRDAAFWEARRWIDRIPDVQASVLLAHGFQDLWRSGHAFQEDTVWELLRAPAWQITGQWQHEFPNFNSHRPEWALRNWNETVVRWLDYWLKGQGPAPAGVGAVSWQDSAGRWHESTAWPPGEARPEALHLAGDRLGPATGEVPRAYRSAPSPLPRARGAEGPTAVPMCGETHPDGVAAGLLYATAPLAEPVVLAGNPMAWLVVESDRPGGLVEVRLFDLAPDFACRDGLALGARALTFGAADLRFVHGNYEARDFPVGTPTGVRIDLANLAEVLEPGHRLAVLVSAGDWRERAGEPYLPTLRVLPASHLLLPLTEGTLGGAPSALDYPPRPFVPS